MKKLIAIDGNSLMHRAYYALPPMMTADGTPTGAVFGFMSMLLRLIQPAPDYLVVAFDMHGPTFRHERYEAYKAGRISTPDDLRTQFPLIKGLLSEMGICISECPRFEADDILGTFSRVANESGVEALVVTGDRDALQLIGSMTHVLMTKRGITDTIEFDEGTLMEHYGVTPDRVPDLKGLMGDGSDNIPGIPGIGEKTARKLLEKYGTLENVLANAACETGALRQKLMDGAELARMSYGLGLIDTHAPITLSLEDCAFDPAHMSHGVKLMGDLELRSLIKRLPDAGAIIKDEAERGAKAAKRVRVDDEEKLLSLLGTLQSCAKLAIHLDFEGVHVAAGPETHYDIAVNATLIERGLDEARVFEALKPIFEDGSKKKLVFDSKGARHSLERFAVGLCGVEFDAMLADYLLHAIHPATSLETLVSESDRDTEAPVAALFGLCDSMTADLASKGMERLYGEMELPLANVLYNMERAGFAVDRTVLEQLSLEFNGRIASTAADIYALAGERFSILSTKQLASILFDKLGLPPQKKTKSGYSTDSEVLEKLLDLHPIVPFIIEYRFLSKLCSTFVDGLMAMIDETGRVHTRFNQNVTATGRISSTEPNLQNIPVRTEVGRLIRKAFVASPGNVLVDADYSQIELRLLAHMSGDANMINAFNSGADIHRRTASEVFNVSFEEVTAAQRSAAKAVNFGIVYGISDFGLAKNLGISRAEAAAYIDLYFARYPGVQRYMQGSVNDGTNDGFVSTLMGRRRDLPELRSANYNTRSFGERVAMNMPIQGTAADIIKLAMVRIYDALEREGLRAKLVLQIHDELIIDAPEDEAERVGALLGACMRSVVELAVPLEAEVKIGHSWFDTK